VAEPSIGRLREILEVMKTKKVMVIGDVMLDRYVWGVVSRISPEAPVPVVDIKDETVRLGGAANVANNIVSLGASCDLVGVVGDDGVGEEIKRAIEDRGIPAKGLVLDEARPTTTKTRVIAHNQQVVRTDREVRDEVDGKTRGTVTELAMTGVDGCDAIIISDYGKGVITKRLLEDLIPAARSAGRIISVDPKEGHFMNYKKVSLITPNHHEAGGALGMRIHDEETLLEAGWRIVDLLETDALLITRGEYGMSLFQKDKTYQHFPTVARHVYDVTGAGDTVISSFTLALSSRASMAEAAHIANHAAGIVIRDVGTATVTPESLVASFEGDDQVP
jgi:D-beta-D-heptose 7-phosphate kinase/D-beta-D-heptose 1-phosphate adenosyltransferase